MGLNGFRALCGSTGIAILVALAAPAPGAAAPVLKTLTDHVPAAARQLLPKAELPATNRLNLAIGLPLRDAAGLEVFLAQLYDPASPNFRQYLTPDQFTARFGPTEAEYAAVLAFAQQNNLTVTAHYPNRLLVDVSGSVADIQRAFRIVLRTYAHPTEARDFYAPDTEPAVEAALTITDISGLNNYALPHPRNLRLDVRPNGVAVPRSGSSPGGGYWGNDFRAAYLPDVALTGTGQQVGLVEFDGFYAVDIARYEAAAGLPSVPLFTVLLDGYSGVPTTGANSGNSEVALDIEMAMAMAPGLAAIVSFEAGPYGLQNDVLNRMVASNQIKQFSCSWGWSGGPSATTDSIFQQMAAQGQSFFSASGDSDAFTAGMNSVNGVDNSSLYNAPSSCPYITVVGGTTLTTTGPGGAWLSETAWNWGSHSGSYVGTSGGISSNYPIPTWQTGISMAANAGSVIFRNTPDVALTADNVYVAYGKGSWASFGGTSCAAPLWAAVAALMNQQATMNGRPAVGFMNPAIYALCQSSTYAAAMHDITTGNNTSSSSPNNFYAVAGYDLCTGWGTPGGQALITAFAGFPDSLGIVPSTGFSAVGPVGGGFNPSAQDCILTNRGDSFLNWSVICPVGWLQATPTDGVLPSRGVTNLTISLSAAAANLGSGAYTATVLFSNSTTQVAQGVSFNLRIGQSLVQNGGFETSDMTGWTLVGHTISHLGSIVYNAVESTSSVYNVVHSGGFGAVLRDNQLATLTQHVPTVPGQSYLLSFWLDNPSAGTVRKFLVKWNSATLYAVTNPPAFAWTNLHFVVSATTASSVLQFGAENDHGYFGLDDVQVTLLPTLALRVATNTADSFSLTWPVANGLKYQLQYTSELAPAQWINLGPSTLATGDWLTSTDTNQLSSSARRFYRVLSSP